MTVWKRNRGDTNDSIIVQLDGVEDLDAALDVKGICWHPNDWPDPEDDPIVTPVEFTGAVLDSANRLVEIPLGTWIDDCRIAKYRYRTRVTFTGPVTKSWPEGIPDTLEINL